MPLLGTAALLLSFDVEPEAMAEHDEWHTHEHLPERLAIPGFLRGTRWVAVHGQPRYLVLYEVERLETLTSGAYLERLNHPTPWTSSLMPHYRGMTRGLCTVLGSAGLGMGPLALLSRFSPAPGAESLLGDWLHQDILARLPRQAGLGSVHLLRAAAAPKMSNEQRLRGADLAVDWALLTTGYSQPALQALAEDELGRDQFAGHGAAGLVSALYRVDYTLTASELVA